MEPVEMLLHPVDRRLRQKLLGLAGEAEDRRRSVILALTVLGRDRLLEQLKVQIRACLRPHEWRRRQFIAKLGEPLLLGARRHGDARVDDEHQRPWRTSSSPATQFGAGLPDGSSCQAGGSGEHLCLCFHVAGSAARGRRTQASHRPLPPRGRIPRAYAVVPWWS